MCDAYSCNKSDISILTKFKFITCTSSGGVIDAPKIDSEVASVDEYHSASNSQPFEPQSQLGGDSQSWSHFHATSPVQQEQSDHEEPIVTTALMTPEKPATLENAKVLLRKADKLLFGNMTRSHRQAEDESEVLESPSSPWSSPSSNESENYLKKARGLLRAAHKMLELVGFKRNDEYRRCEQNGQEVGSPIMSAELSEKGTMDWEPETAVESSRGAELQDRIRDLEARLRDVIVDLDNEKQVNTELRRRLGI